MNKNKEIGFFYEYFYYYNWNKKWICMLILPGGAVLSAQPPITSLS